MRKRKERKEKDEKKEIIRKIMKRRSDMRREKE